MESDLSRVHIIGTSHIAKESVLEIESFLNKNHIDVVCVELDRERLFALQHKTNSTQKRLSLKNIGLIKQIGFAGFVFALLASYVQQKLGKTVDVTPGSDMLAAVNLAKKNNLSIALLDQNVNVTLRNVSKQLPFKEKWRMVTDIVKGLFGVKSALSPVSIEDLDLKKVPSGQIIDMLLEKTKDRYPVFYDVLVQQRNVYMAKRLLQILKNHPDWHILVVIGAGHKQGMISYLEKHFKTTYLPIPKQKQATLVYSDSYAVDDFEQ